MKTFYFFIRVDLYFIGVFGYLWVEVRFVNDIGVLLVYYVVRGEGLVVGGLRGGGVGGERFV